MVFMCDVYSSLDPIQVGYDPTIYRTSETEGSVTLNIHVFSHPTDGAPQPFDLIVSTRDDSAGMYVIDYEWRNHDSSILSVT